MNIKILMLNSGCYLCPKGDTRVNTHKSKHDCYKLTLIEHTENEQKIALTHIEHAEVITQIE